MRRIEAETLVAEEPRLLSTGEAAQLLGVSRQHVVDLCSSGRLPYVLVGKHRRVRSDDVDMLRTGSGRQSRDQVRSALMAHAIAGRLVLDPDRGIALARDNIRSARAKSARGATDVWLNEWERLLDEPVSTIVAALTSPSPRSRELRQNNPFAGLLTAEERDAVLATSRRGSAAGGAGDRR